MKKIMLLMALMLSAFAIVGFSQQYAVVQPAGAVEINQDWLIYICAIAGLLSHTVYNTIKGIMNKANQTPTSFDLGLWLKDNIQAKVSGVLALVGSIMAVLKLPISISGHWYYLVLVFIAGFVYDFVADFGRVVTQNARQ